MKELLTSSDDLIFFNRIASRGSLTAVAQELGLSLPAVSKRLRQLEQRLGVQLVQRTTRSLSLTPEGQLYLEGARPILSQLEELESAVSNRQPALRGHLSINATFGFGRRHVAPAVSAFAELNPQLEISLQLSSQPVSLLDEGIDIDIRVGEPPDSRLIAQRLLHNPRILCAAPAYLERAGVPKEVTELAQHNCILLRQYGSDYALWRFHKDGRDYVQKVSGTLLSNDGEVVVNLGLAGHGLILRSRWDVQQHIDSGRLRVLLPDYRTPRADIYAVFQQRRHTPQRITTFINYLAKTIEQSFDRTDQPGVDAE